MRLLAVAEYDQQPRGYQEQRGVVAHDITSYMWLRLRKNIPFASLKPNE
jgi:hypothetical protein